MVKRYVLALLAACSLTLALASPAIADAPAPGWEVFGRVAPTNLPPGGEGELFLYVYNIGAAQGSEGPTVVDTLPTGVTARAAEAGFAYGGGGSCSGSTVVTCKLDPIAPIDTPTLIQLPVNVESEVSNVLEPVDRVTVSGGGALAVTNSTVPMKFDSELTGFGFSNFDAWFANADGTTDTQAGSHPYDLTVAFSTNVSWADETYSIPTGGNAHYINVNLPPGIVGDPTAIPECTREEFDNEAACPPGSQIGEDITTIAGIDVLPQPIYNMVPPAGVAAQFAFEAFNVETFVDARVRSGGDAGITVRTAIPDRRVSFNSTTIWGVPAEHNGSGLPNVPYLTLPTSCRGPQEFSAELLGSWQNESLRPPPARSLTRDNEGAQTGFTGCERLVHFAPSVELAPDTSFSDTPAGLTATVRVPQGLNPEGLATPGLKETTVTLPQGVAINPGQATGLVACQPSEEDIGGETEAFDEAPSCPAASKVGTDEIATPLLPKRLKGNVYILPAEPPNLQLLVAASGEGVNLKLIGTVHLNEATGQLTTTFKGTPQDPGTPDAPLTEFVLSFSGGAQAALATPTTCGVYTSSADFTPWASPFVEDALLQNSFAITSGPNGSGLAGCTAPLPFTPTMTAGATTDQAGGYTDFTMLLTRGDGQQRIEKLQFKTPEGLLGMISKVPLCQEPQAAKGECPEASQIGHTVVTAGPGPYPFQLPQSGAPPAPIYLTAPYDGAPFGLSIAVPLIAGPFNLGTEVVRAKIEVDPLTSQLTITTGPVPFTVKGIPTDIRAIDAVIDRPDFMFNPTSCESRSFSGTAYSHEGATAPLSSHFQMGSCRALTFQPNLQVSTPGKVSRTDGTSLSVKIVYPTGNLGANQASSQANIKSVKVELPKQMPSRLTTLQKACRIAIFETNPADCPPESRVGFATALTPVLPVPVKGPAYFVSNGSAKFPELIVVLQGYGVTVDLRGNTFISKSGITSATFESIPDVPIGSFELEFPAGPYSALTGVGNLCKEHLQMPSYFVGQNGAVLNTSTKISVTGCAATKKAITKPKKHKAKKHKKQHKARGSKKKSKKS